MEENRIEIRPSDTERPDAKKIHKKHQNIHLSKEEGLCFLEALDNHPNPIRN